MKPAGRRRLRRIAKAVAVGLVLTGLLYAFPRFTLVSVGGYLLLGLVDVGRHGRWKWGLLRAYFAGKGFLTWVLSPLNLFFDLISRRHPYRLTLDDFSPEERAEIREVLDVFDRRGDEITASLRERMRGRQRGMLFHKWYDRNADRSVPEFNEDYRYVKTIGVSVFNSRVKTSLHFGPLRLTVRLLYNLTPRESDRIFIEVNEQIHYWHDDPLFIFDDTIQHRSVNDDEGERFCAFVDVLRPSRFTRLQNAGVRALGKLLAGANRVFYKNWDMLAQRPAHRP